MSQRSQPSQDDPHLLVHTAIENTIVLNIERVIVEHIRKQFPSSLALSSVQRILDVPSGLGEWVIDMARQFPHIEVHGIDSNLAMTRYAQNHAADLKNVRFVTSDLLQMSVIADYSIYDLVHTHSIARSISLMTLQDILDECRRITCPGGILLMVEIQMELTGSSAFASWDTLITHALAVPWQGIGLVKHLDLLLQDAGYGNIQQEKTLVDASPSQNELFPLVYNAVSTLSSLLSPLIQDGRVSADEVERIRQQMLREMLQDDFEAYFTVVMTWGYKPLEDELRGGA